MTTLTSVVFLIPFKYLNFKHFGYIIPGLLVILSVGLNYNYFRPHDFLGRTDSYYINRYIPVPVASTDYLATQEEYLRLPLGTERRPDKNYPIIFSDARINYNVLETNGVYSKIDVNLGGEALIHYSKYYFPGWTAKIDGKPVQVTIGKPFGQIAITVPKGEHILEFNFGETWYKIIIDAVSAVSLLVMLALGFRKMKL